MTYKRGTDHLPIPPKDAKSQNVTCDFCIVGCGYKAYTWPINKQGGTAAGQKAKYNFLINNGRKNLIWQNAFYDIRTPFVDERFPAPPIEMSPDDMKKLGVEAGDLVEVYNDVGSTQAMAYPIASAKKGECFMLFCSPRGQIGNVVSEHCNELRIPNYKNVWANIRKIGRGPNADAVSFKELEMPQNV